MILCRYVLLCRPFFWGEGGPQEKQYLVKEGREKLTYPLISLEKIRREGKKNRRNSLFLSISSKNVDEKVGSRILNFYFHIYPSPHFCFLLFFYKMIYFRAQLTFQFFFISIRSNKQKNNFTFLSFNLFHISLITTNLLIYLFSHHFLSIQILSLNFLPFHFVSQTK